MQDMTKKQTSVLRPPHSLAKKRVAARRHGAAAAAAAFSGDNAVSLWPKQQRTTTAFNRGAFSHDVRRVRLITTHKTL